MIHMNISCMCAHRAAWIKHFLSYLVSDSMSSGIDQKNPPKNKKNRYQEEWKAINYECLPSLNLFIYI